MEGVFFFVLFFCIPFISLITTIFWFLQSGLCGCVEKETRVAAAVKSVASYFSLQSLVGLCLLPLTEIKVGEASDECIFPGAT